MTKTPNRDEETAMGIGDRVKITLKINARSTDPITGEQNLADSFRPIKRGTAGTVEALLNDDNEPAVGGRFALVRFDGITTRQAIRSDCFQVI